MTFSNAKAKKPSRKGASTEELSTLRKEILNTIDLLGPATKRAEQRQAEKKRQAEELRLEKERLAEEARIEEERLATEAAEKAEQDRLRRIAEKEEILRQKEEERLQEEERLESERMMAQEEYGSYAEYTTVNSDLKPARELTEDEVERLQAILKIQVESDPKFNMLHDGQDYEDLIEYAFDMISDKESVGHVVEEVQFMEFKCFNEEVAKRFGKVLTRFFSDLK